MKLPSTRFLAQNLGVSRITVFNAYEQLLAEGYAEGKTGAGTFVASVLPDDLLQTTKRQTTKNEVRENAPLNLSEFGRSGIGAGGDDRSFSAVSKRSDGG